MHCNVVVYENEICYCNVHLNPLSFPEKRKGGTREVTDSERASFQAGPLASTADAYPATSPAWMASKVVLAFASLGINRREELH